MITLIIVGILSSMAYFSYEKFVLKTKQTEAKVNLQMIHSAQKLYLMEKGKYAPDIESLNLDDLSDDSLYGYEIKLGSKKLSYTAKASGNLDGDSDMDVWTIDAQGTLSNTSNDI